MEELKKQFNNQKDVDLNSLFKEHYKYILNFLKTSKDLIFITDREGKVILCSNSVKNKLGYSLEEIYKKDYYFIFSSDCKDKINNAICQGKDLINFKVKLRTKEEEFIGLLSLTPILENNEIVGSISIIREAKEEFELVRKLKQQIRDLKKKIKAKDDFFTSTIHELKNPFTAIIGYCNMFEEEKFGPFIANYKKIIETIKLLNKELMLLLEDLLIIGQIQEGKYILNKTQVDLNEILKNVITIMNPLAEKKQIQLFTSSPEEQVIVSGDAIRIQQILFNLIHNAIKFTGRGGKVSIEIEPEEEEEEVKVAVSDTGIGIREEQQKLIFKKFTKINERVPGSGLGLFIASRFVELHRGRIWVKSKLGKGTTFYFTLPTPTSSKYTEGAENTYTDMED